MGILKLSFKWQIFYSIISEYIWSNLEWVSRFEFDVTVIMSPLVLKILTLHSTYSIVLLYSNQPQRVRSFSRIHLNHSHHRKFKKKNDGKSRRDYRNLRGESLDTKLALLNDLKCIFFSFGLTFTFQQQIHCCLLKNRLSCFYLPAVEQEACEVLRWWANAMMGKFTYKELLKVEYLFKILIV